MPSSFPGMDLFLEHPDEFPQLHDGFFVHLREKLQTLLPLPYFAKIGQRVWVEVSERDVEPDVSVLRPGKTDSTNSAGKVGILIPREILMREALPAIQVPLLESDGIVVDLQEVFNQTYDLAVFRRWVRYDLDRIQPPLSPDLMEWAKPLLSSLS